MKDQEYKLSHLLGVRSDDTNRGEGSKDTDRVHS